MKIFMIKIIIYAVKAIGITRKTFQYSKKAEHMVSAKESLRNKKCILLRERK